MSARLAAFVERESRAFLFSRDENGWPIGYAMNVIGCADGALWFTTYAKSRKVTHFTADAEAACVVMGDDGTWASVRGRLVVSRMDAASAAIVEPMVRGQHRDPRVPAGVLDKALDRLASGKRVVLRLDVEEQLFGPGAVR